MLKHKNQIRRPTINKIGQTQKDPKKVRLYFKSGNCTMLVARMHHYDALRLESRIRKFLKDINVKLEGTFIQTQ